MCTSRFNSAFVSGGLSFSSSSSSSSSFFRAAFDGDESGIYAALEAGTAVDAPDVHGNTALRIATMRG